MTMQAAFNDADIDRKLTQVLKGSEDKFCEMYSYVGEQFVNDARGLDSYIDRSGNLRASVGYIIANNGKVVSENIEGKSPEGVATARKILKNEARKYPKMIVLIVIAGMNYAAAVESKGYDVLSGSASKAEKLLKNLKAKVVK